MKVSGRCYCGQISFEAEIEPDKVRVCHCTDCQTLSGSAFRANVPVVEGTFVLQKGEPKNSSSQRIAATGLSTRSARIAAPRSIRPFRASHPAIRCELAPWIAAPNLFPRGRSGGARRCRGPPICICPGRSGWTGNRLAPISASTGATISCLSRSPYSAPVP